MVGHAINACTKVSKPSEEHAKHLARLYPCSTSPSTSKDTFNPIDDAFPFNPKKMSRRPFKLWVVIGDKMFTSIPKSTQRKSLNRNGRIKKLEFRRSMSPLQVKNVIVRSFPTFQLQNPTFMKCVDLQMVAVDVKEGGYPSGNEIQNIASKESLYVVESQVCV